MKPSNAAALVRMKGPYQNHSSVAELALLLGVAKGTIKVWVRSGKISPGRTDLVPGIRLWPPEEVTAILQQRKRGRF